MARPGIPPGVTNGPSAASPGLDCKPKPAARRLPRDCPVRRERSFRYCQFDAGHGLAVLRYTAAARVVRTTRLSGWRSDKRFHAGLGRTSRRGSRGPSRGCAARTSESAGPPQAINPVPWLQSRFEPVLTDLELPGPLNTKDPADQCRRGRGHLGRSSPEE